MKCNTSSARRRDGFTLLELLVVVGIIAVLAAMLFPAVQRLREMANRTRCVNNLHQLGMALSNHFGTHQSFPTNGAVVPSNGVIGAGYYQYGLSSFPGAPPAYMWGMGDPMQGPKNQTGSWAYSILPYMEEANTFGSDSRFFGANGNYLVTVGLFMCPSRGRLTLPLPSPPLPPPYVDPLWTSPQWFYNANWSPSPGGQATTLLPQSFDASHSGWSKTDYAGNYLLMPSTNLQPNGTLAPFLDLRAFRGARNYPIAPADITDGAANTIIVGEKAMAVKAYNTGGWYWDEPIFVGGSGGTIRNAPCAPPFNNTNSATPFYSQPQFPSLPFYYATGVVPDNDPGNDPGMMPPKHLFANNWGSAHPGGVNFLFADGSVRTFNYNVDPSLFQGLLTPAGSDPTPSEN